MMNDYKFLFEGEYQDLDGNTEKHEVFDAGLRDGAKLHRFCKRLSAIYQDDEEKIIGFRSGEAEMIAAWNAGKERQGADTE